MNHICVYNDKLVLMHGKQLIVDLELAFAADDIKQLRIAMGMGMESQSPLYLVEATLRSFILSCGKELSACSKA